MKPLIATLVGIAALSGCATTAGYEKLLSQWVGADEAALVRQWGPPLRAYDAGGRRFLAYEIRSDIVLPEVLPTYQTSVKGNKVTAIPVGGSPATVVNYLCTTTFELKSGRVVGSTYSGNNCKAKS